MQKLSRHYREMTFMMIRWRFWQRAKSPTNGLSMIRSIERLVETEYWYRYFDSARARSAGKFVKSTIWRRWIHGIKLLQKKRARVNTHKCGNLCNNRAIGEVAIFLAAFNYSDAFGRLNRLLVFARKTKLRMTTARNSNITISLEYQQE